MLHQVGTPEAARAAESAGVDALIAQGIEAGGHVHGRIGAFALAAEMLAGTELPVVVSGGIVDGAGLAAALAMGTDGVHCGTAFLVTDESFAHPSLDLRNPDGTDDRNIPVPPPEADRLTPEIARNHLRHDTLEVLDRAPRLATG